MSGHLTGISISFAAPPAHLTHRRAAILLDRDGVINRRRAHGYVTQWREFRFLPGIKQTLAQLSRLAVPLIVVSNQAGVGKGLVTAAVLQDITRRFVAALAHAGAPIAAVYYCPHTPQDDCECRKPRPGLLQRAAHDWRLDLKKSVLIGDSLSDLEAARAVHCPAIWLAPDGLRRSEPSPPSGTRAIVASNLGEIPGIVDELLRQSRRK